MRDVFSRLAPFIQDYIYFNNWKELRPIQVAACNLILDTDDNILLSSGTASGKTEAAFLPILTDIYEKPASSVSVLYISPLKALINDQFIRIEDMLKETDIKVTKWHGDVAQNVKTKLIRNPKGIIQTTPESLEAMLMRNSGNILRLFSDLRYIVIDEVHYFMNDDRGMQLLCILERIQRIIKKEPRRIGLSATLGNYDIAKKWLNFGTNRKCEMPDVEEEKRRIRLGIKYYELEEREGNLSILDYYNDLYKYTLNKKCIIFSNSKAEVEENIAHLKKIAEARKTKDIYYVHHANISNILRKQAEEQMKNEEENAVTGATVTLELGIDLGKLDRIIQTGSPFTVSSFVQRLGRSGRRGQPSEMLFLFKEEKEDKPKEFYEEIDFEFIKCIAIIELYVKERWIETMEKNDLPYSLLYHQTMSYLYSMGAVTPKELAKYILTLKPFKKVSTEDYKNLLKYLLEKEELEKDEEGNLLIGRSGERKVNSFNFFSVFTTPIEYSVRNSSQEIGTVQTPYLIGQQFSLAGFTWKVVDINEEKRQIFVKKVGGISKIAWNDDGNIFINTKIMKKMKEVLEDSEEYRYLNKDALEKLKEIRNIAKMTGILENKVITLEKGIYGIIPWLGTKEIIALEFSLKEEGINGKTYYRTGIPIFILIESKSDLDININKEYLENLLEKLKTKNIDKTKFKIPDLLQKSGKYNSMIPKELLHKQFIEDCIDVEGMKKNL